MTGDRGQLDWITQTSVCMVGGPHGDDRTEWVGNLALDSVHGATGSEGPGKPMHGK